MDDLLPDSPNSPSLSPESPFATAADAPIVMYSLSDSYLSQNPNEETKKTQEDVTSKNEMEEADRTDQIDKPKRCTLLPGKTRDQIDRMVSQNGTKVSTKRRTRSAKIRSESSSEEEIQEEVNLASISNLPMEDERVVISGLERERGSNLPQNLTERMVEGGSNLPKNLKEIIEVSSGDLDEPRNAEMDILEIGKMKMKELETERPPWHRVGGYPDL